MYLANLYVSHLDLIVDGIEASLDVLGPLVKSGFLCQGNCTSIVTEDYMFRPKRDITASHPNSYMVGAKIQCALG